MLPALKVTCHCNQCQGYALSVLNYVKQYGSYSYGDLSPVWASQPFCAGSCGTHAACGACDYCGDQACDCECDKCESCDRLSDYCECCPGCGSGEACSYCDRCDEYDCQCGCNSYSSSEARFGTIKTAPWIDRGVEVDKIRTRDRDEVRSLWGVDNTIDICQSAADFYLLKAMSAAGAVYSDAEINMDSFLRYFRHEAETLLSALTLRLDATFRGYVDMIIGGELRHHRAASTSTLKNTDRSSAWGEWYAIRSAAGVSALSDAETLFVDFHSTSYGGEAWARIARTLRERLQGKRSAAQFVDNVFSLEHNGGCLFDKSSWAVHNSMNWNYGYLGQYVLPAHGAMNPWPILLLVASDEVRNLFYETWRQANRVRLALGRRPLPVPSRPQYRKGYYGERYIDSEDITPDMVKSGTWS